ncbi:MAG TPA: MBL fold metallo-hydrolase [Acidimicrobiales bacterium]|nr:MBL fold metallo-hydrolase [Acidimicrobiales bacterium]
MTSAFAGYPAPFVYDEPDGKKTQQLLWGDYVKLGDEVRGEWQQVAKARNESGWMRKADLQKERLLEINFVDVGQGDGCFVVTPGDKRILIDAGLRDNMFWYLRWRFNLRQHPDNVIDIEHAIISHPDSDHYQGFDAILDSPQLSIGTLHHNGLIDHEGNQRLGPTTTVGRRKFYTDLMTTKTKLRRSLTGIDPGKKYPALLRKALKLDRVGDIQMLSSLDSFLPGYASGDLTIQVLAPVPETIERKPALRRLGIDGVTKNGHSVVLLLTYRGVRFLLGGDLNREAMEYLLEHYEGQGSEEGDGTEHSVFRADVAKACHHGSADVSDSFVAGVNAIATVISSGDNEPYAHPRPDALGLIGKHGRGDRPLIFSTELARSPSEAGQGPERLRTTRAAALDAARVEINEGNASTEEQPGHVAAAYQRAIAVYGMINVRSDGERVIIAQKLERDSTAGKQFDVSCLEPDDEGNLVYNPKPKKAG